MSKPVIGKYSNEQRRFVRSTRQELGWNLERDLPGLRHPERGRREQRFLRIAFWVVFALVYLALILRGF